MAYVTLALAATAWIAGSSAGASAPTFTASPATSLVSPAAVSVEATNVTASSGVVLPFLPLGPLLPTSVLQCDASVVAVDPEVSDLASFSAFQAELDERCTLLDIVDVEDGVVTTTVTVEQPFEAGRVTVLGGPSRDIDCSVNGCVLLLVGASGVVDGPIGEIDGEVTLDTLVAMPIDFAPTLRIGSVSTREMTGATTTVEVPVGLSQPLDDPLAFTWRLEGQGSAALDSGDVVATSGLLTVDAGSVATSIPIGIVGDADPESTETARIVIDGLPSSVVPHVIVDGLVTVIDDDAAATPNIDVNPVSGLVPGSEIVVRAVGVVDNGGLVGAPVWAFRPAVYQCSRRLLERTPPSVPAPFPAGFFDVEANCRALTPATTPTEGVLEATVTVNPTFETGPTNLSSRRDVDCSVEGCLIAVLSLSGEVPVSETLDTLEWARIDFRPRVTPGISAIVEGDEGISIVEVPVRMSSPVDEPVSVSFRTVDDLGNPFVARSGLDYEATVGSVTFAPGETEAAASIAVYGDTIVDERLLWGEWGIVQFEEVTGPAALDLETFFGAGVFVIVDDDT